MRRRKIGKKRRGLRVFIIFFVALFFLFFLIDSQLRPIVKNMAQVRAQALSTQVINQAITDVLADENITYDQLVGIRQNENGRVIAMNTDIIELNRLKAQINLKVQDALSQVENSIVSVPIGTLLGNDFLIGRGPSIKIKIKLANNIVSNIEYAFESAGINQTLHQINLLITANIYAIIPWYNTSTQVDTNFCLAETVIVGEVPDAFTHVADPHSEMVGDIEDYGADTDN